MSNPNDAFMLHDEDEITVPNGATQITQNAFESACAGAESLTEMGICLAAQSSLYQLYSINDGTTFVMECRHLAEREYQVSEAMEAPCERIVCFQFESINHARDAFTSLVAESMTLFQA